MKIIGKQFVNNERMASGEPFSSHDTATGEALPYLFYQATRDEVLAAANAAESAYPIYRQRSLQDRAAFLEAIATKIEKFDDEFFQVVMRETGLAKMRLQNERARTASQLRLFAEVVRKGDFLGARIDTAIAERQPTPRPDIRQYRIGLGPVAVFGASNFPLAFSVAGGDTASALAAGCPVVVKVHPGHPATADLVGQAIVTAVKECHMPAGVFGMVFGGDIGGDLVKASGIKAVGFTGSLKAGRLICDLAAAREQPIPVFAEMASVNPVILLPGALAERGAQIARELADSVNLGAGQFCTKPGLVIGLSGEAFTLFCRQFAAAIEAREPAVMLNNSILKNYQEGIKRLQQTEGIEALTCGQKAKNRAQSWAFSSTTNLLSHPQKPLEEEVFGPCIVVLAMANLQEFLELVPTLNGQLTASLWASEADRENCGELLAALETRVGRLILNSYPTGVEVCDAMVHGGPYPATSDSRSTSVGTQSIERFLRPVCYQGYPEELLPAALKNNNLLGLRRLINGQWTEDSI